VRDRRVRAAQELRVTPEEGPETIVAEVALLDPLGGLVWVSPLGPTPKSFATSGGPLYWCLLGDGMPVVKGGLFVGKSGGLELDMLDGAYFMIHLLFLGWFGWVGGHAFGAAAGTSHLEC
jgi:hypothetical protein